MAQVLGTTSTMVNVSKDELFKGLCKEIGVYEYIYEEPTDGYYQTSNDMVFLFENVATHGSPKYKITWEKRDQNLVNKIKTMKELKKIIETE